MSKKNTDEETLLEVKYTFGICNNSQVQANKDLNDTKSPNVQNKSKINLNLIEEFNLDRDDLHAMKDGNTKNTNNNDNKNNKKNPSSVFPENFNVIFLGETKVGKSCLIYRMMNKSFKENHDETIIDNYRCERFYEESLNNNKSKNDKIYSSKNTNANYLSTNTNSQDNYKNNKFTINENEHNFDKEIDMDLSYSDIENKISNNKSKKKEKKKNRKNKVKLNKESYAFRIIDTGDFHVYYKSIAEVLKFGHCVILVYSVNNRSSFDKIKIIYEKVKEINKELKNIILVGNKKDISDESKVNYLEAVDFANERNIKVIETSAKDNLNIHKIFQLFIDVELKRSFNDNEEENYTKCISSNICKCF